MNELIKKIREYLGLSQMELAEKMGVQFATINRWENGHSIPTRLAQEKLYLLCVEFNVPIYEMIINKINEEISSIKREDDRILLYHGSKSGLIGDIKPSSRTRCDFGKGFYMGTSIEQPLTLICDYEESKFYVLSSDLKGLEVYKSSPDLDWAMLIAYYRGRMDMIENTSFYNKYSLMLNGKDIVIGTVADDRMFYVLDNFFLGNVSDVALVESLTALNLNEQYVALTEKACKAIKIEKEIEISYLEKNALKKESEINRNKGISLANEICKNNRRKGIFFDEILKKAKMEK